MNHQFLMKMEVIKYYLKPELEPHSNHQMIVSDNISGGCRQLVLLWNRIILSKFRASEQPGLKLVTLSLCQVAFLGKFNQAKDKEGWFLLEGVAELNDLAKHTWEGSSPSAGQIEPDF